MRGVIIAILTCAALPALAAPGQIAPGTWLIAGGIPRDRQPDGNTVVWQGRGGLIVLDTGRHLSQSDAILALADQRHAPVAAIINSHWHLDHVSGNPRLKAKWLDAKVYATAAINDALTGFLARGAKANAQMVAEGALPPDTLDDLKIDMATVADGEALKPDVTVSQTQDVRLAGKRLVLHVAHGATAGDIWVYDPATKLVASGDLVTLPVPFLDTADARAWSQALGEIAATDFVKLVPGHGAVMTRAQFAQYRGAFDRFIACAATQSKSCGEDWVTDTASLRDPGDEKRARGMIGYYVDLLRKPS